LKKILERAGVAGAHDFQRLLGQALPFLQLAGEEFDPGDAFNFFHWWCSFECWPQI
jgi:hypothetical protein